MTTPDTADVRTWARKNGMTVSDRGRLPAEVHEAYLAARKGNASPTPAAKKRPAPAGKKSTPARKQPARGATGSAAPRAVPKTAPAAQPRAAAARSAPAESAVPAQPAKPVDAKPVDRVDALHEQVAALTSRVVKLEQAQAAPKRSLFSRKS